MNELPAYWKWRCTECREEFKHSVYLKGKIIEVGACKCTAPRHLEVVPMTKVKYEARLMK